MFLLLVRAGTTLVSQSPCSSIAALPLASRPAELPAPVWAWVALNPPWNGLVPMNAVRSLVAWVKHGAVMLTALMEDCRTDSEHSLTAKYSQKNASGQRLPPPSAIGAKPAALSLASSDSSCAIVVGGVVMPALANRSVRYQKPTTC